MSDLDKLVNDWVKKNKNTNSGLKGVMNGIVKDKADELLESIKSKTSSNTVKKSIFIKKDGDNYVISFDDSAWRDSIFKGSPFNIDTYSPDAYTPILYNEGWEVKDEKWKNYFGRGSEHEAEHFIEKAVKEFTSKNKGVKVEVIKKGIFKYRTYTSSIDEYEIYGDYSIGGEAIGE